MEPEKNQSKKKRSMQNPTEIIKTRYKKLIQHQVFIFNVSFLHSTIMEKLREIFYSSNINHKIAILQQPDLKHAHMYSVLERLTGPETGPLIEHYIKEKFSMTKNKASLCMGDLQYKERNLEIKISNGGKTHDEFNYVQLRMNHMCEYLLTAYYLHESNLDSNGELFMFYLKKQDLKSLILKYGGYAHGTIKKLGPITESDLNDVTNDKEYAIRPKYGDKCWADLLFFRTNELDV